MLENLLQLFNYIIYIVIKSLNLSYSSPAVTRRGTCQNTSKGETLRHLVHLSERESSNLKVQVKYTRTHTNTQPT